MMLTINFIIFILFVVYIVVTWRSTEVFEGIPTRILYLVIGTAFVSMLTFIFFLFSKIGVEYPKPEMVGEVRREILLIFIPLNGFIILPQIANFIARVKEGDTSKEELQKKMRRILIICVVLIIFECIYFKNIQNGIIEFLQERSNGV